MLKQALRWKRKKNDHKVVIHHPLVRNSEGIIWDITDSEIATWKRLPMVYVLWWKDQFNKYFPLGRLSKSVMVVIIWFSAWLRHKLESSSSSSPKCEFDWVWTCTSLLIRWNLLHQKMGNSWDNAMSIALIVPLSISDFFRFVFFW